MAFGSVAYYFPPQGCVGVQRTLKHVKYLPQFGWHPVVLTAQPQSAALSDPSLTQELPTDQQVIATSALMLPKALPWRRATG